MPWLWQADHSHACVKAECTAETSADHQHLKLSLSASATCRAYTAYLRLSFPSEAFAPVQASAAAPGVEHLLQQSKSGIEIPKPARSDVREPQADLVPHTAQAPLGG